MEIVLLLFGAVLGALSSWGIQHVYSVRTSAEQNILFRKLSAEVRKAILEDERDRLSSVELSELLKHEVELGKLIKYKAKGDKDDECVYSYVVCPNCGSDDLKKFAGEWTVHDPDGERYKPAHFVMCNKCAWIDSDDITHEGNQNSGEMSHA